MLIDINTIVPVLVCFHRGCSRMMNVVDVVTNLLSYVLHLRLEQNRHKVSQTAALKQEM